MSAAAGKVADKRAALLELAPEFKGKRMPADLWEIVSESNTAADEALAAVRSHKEQAAKAGPSDG